MELQKGICFLCCNTKVLTLFDTEKAIKIICSLFSKNILDSAELKNIQSSLRLCPVCYHKMMILKRTMDNIEMNTLEDEDTKNCLFCKSEKNSFKIINWPYFTKISGDLVSKDKDVYFVCSECFFYLDARNDVKTKLFEKYPQLKVEVVTKNTNKRKGKFKYGLETISDSSAGIENKTDKDINIFSENSIKTLKHLCNSDVLNKLTPLKHNRNFKLQELVKSDSKFINQIPYVLLKGSNFSDKHNDRKVHNEINDEKQKKKDSKKISDAEFTTYSKSIRIKQELRKHDIVKDLAVDLPKMNISQMQKAKPRNYNPDSEIEKLIDKFSVLQRSTTTSTNQILEGSSRDDFDLMKESEISSNVKAKRKSVSFAEEKNVEIEYIQNDSDLKNDSLANNYEKQYTKGNELISNPESVNKQDIINKDSQGNIQNGILTEEIETNGDYVNSNEETGSKITSKIAIENKTQFIVSPNISNDNVINKEDTSNDSINNLDENKGSDGKTINELQLKTSEENNLRRHRQKPVVFDLEVVESFKECDRSMMENEIFEEHEDASNSKEYIPSPLSKKTKGNANIDFENIVNINSNELSESLKINIENSEMETNSDGANKMTCKDDVNSLSKKEEISKDIELEGTIKEFDNLVEDENHKGLGNIDEEATNNESHKEDISINLDSEKGESDSSEKIKLRIECVGFKSNDCISSIKGDENVNNLENKTNSNESKVVSEIKFTQLIDEYLDEEIAKDCEKNEIDNKSESEAVSINNEELNKVGSDNKNEESDDAETEDKGSHKKIENVESFSSSDKNEELGISEEDKNNINSILNDVFPQEQRSDEQSFEKYSCDNISLKRKSNDQLNSGVDKKKKKVTFCENLT